MDKKLGPLKAWQWGLILAALALLYWYEKRKSASAVMEPSESFMTGSPIGQGAGSEAGAGNPGEQPTPLPPEPHQQEQAIAPGLGAGQLFATEVGEVKEGQAALESLGVIKPAQSTPAKHNARTVRHKAKAPKKRRGPTHARQGAHHHRQQHTHRKPHSGAHKTTAAHKTGGTEAPSQHHGSTHHHRRRRK